MIMLQTNKSLYWCGSFIYTSSEIVYTFCDRFAQFLLSLHPMRYTFTAVSVCRALCLDHDRRTASDRRLFRPSACRRSHPFLVLLPYYTSFFSFSLLKTLLVYYCMSPLCPLYGEFAIIRSQAMKRLRV